MYLLILWSFLGWILIIFTPLTPSRFMALPTSLSLFLPLSKLVTRTSIFVDHLFLNVGPPTGAWLTIRSHTLGENWLFLPQNHQLSKLLSWTGAHDSVMLRKYCFAQVFPTSASCNLSCPSSETVPGGGWVMHTPHEWTNTPMTHILCTWNSYQFLCKSPSTGQRNICNVGCTLY